MDKSLWYYSWKTECNNGVRIRNDFSEFSQIPGTNPTRYQFFMKFEANWSDILPL